MIDVIIDISSIYGRAAIGDRSQGYLEDQQGGHNEWSQQQDGHGKDEEDVQGGHGHGNSQAVVSSNSQTGSVNEYPVQTGSSHEAFSVIKMGNGTVLYLREVNKYLALICLLRAETFEKQGLIDYNVHC